jgi:hypothetical protein
MEQVYTKFEEAYRACEEENRLIKMRLKDKQSRRMTKRELFKRFSVFFNRCLLLMRAYNFDAKLVEMIGKY